MQHIVPTTITGADTLFRECLAHLLSDTPFRSVECPKKRDGQADEQPVSGQSSLQIIVALDRLDDGHKRCRVVAEIDKIKRQNAEATIVVVGRTHDRSAISDLLTAGIDGYISATTDAHTLIKLLDLAVCGQLIVPNGFVRAMCRQQVSPAQTIGAVDPRLLDSAGSENGASARTTNGRPMSVVTKLSSREQAILRFLMRGYSNKVIARDLDIAEATTKTHIKTILRKIGVSNRTQAAIWGVRNLMAHQLERSGEREDGTEDRGVGNTLADTCG